MPGTKLRWEQQQYAWYNLRSKMYVAPAPTNPRDAWDLRARKHGLIAKAGGTGPMISPASMIVHTGQTLLTGPNPDHPLGWWVGHDFRDQVRWSYFGAQLKHCIMRGSPAGQPSRNAIGFHAALDSSLGGAVIEDSLIANQNPSPTGTGITNGWVTIRRTEIKGFVDGIGLTGTTTFEQPTVIEGNYIHANAFFQWTPGDPNYPPATGGYTHSDGTQFQRGKNILVAGNYYGGHQEIWTMDDGCNNACIMLSQSVSSSDDDRVEDVDIYHNIFEGGAACVNLAPNLGNNLSTVKVRSNDFVRRRPNELIGLTGNPPNNYILRGSGFAGVVDDNRYMDTGLLIPING